MAQIKLGDLTLPFNPTSENYSMSFELTGDYSRDINGTLQIQNPKRYRVWEILVHPDDQAEAIGALMDGSSFTYTDVDESTYSAALVPGSGPIKGYPRENLGMMQLIIEAINAEE